MCNLKLSLLVSVSIKYLIAYFQITNLTILISVVSSGPFKIALPCNIILSGLCSYVTATLKGLTDETRPIYVFQYKL